MSSNISFKAGFVEVSGSLESQEIISQLSSDFPHSVIPSYYPMGISTREIYVSEETLGKCRITFQDNAFEIRTDGKSGPIDLIFSLMGPIDRVAQEKFDCFMFHSSAVYRGQKCVILSGNRGDGKTLTALALKQRGFLLLSGDYTLLCSADNEIFACGGTRAVKIRPSAINEHLPDFGSKVIEEGPKGYQSAVHSVIDYVPPSEKKVIEGLFLTKVEKRPKLLVDYFDPVYFCQMAYPDLSKYVKGNYLYTPETPGIDFDLLSLANKRIGALKRLSRKPIIRLQGSLESITDFITSKMDESRA